MTNPTPNQYPQNDPNVQYVPVQAKKPWYKKPGCMVPLILVIIVLVALGGCMALAGKAVNDVSNDMNKEHEITYKLGGDAQDALATFNTGDADQTQENNLKAGWEKTVKVKGFVGGYVSATNGMYDTGTITCEIVANGKTVVQNTASGQGATASCNASQDEIKKAFE